MPLAVEFGKKYQTIGFDINQQRIEQLSQGIDTTLEVTAAQLLNVKHLSFTSSVSDLTASNFYIVTVPTPIDIHKQPDLTPLLKASEMLGRVINKGDIVVFESMAYLGATEEECIPQNHQL